MKINLQDISFIILVRLDSVERLENTVVVANDLAKHFDTNIYVLEAASYCNGILKQALNRKINYRFVEDKDPVLHKTLYYNRMVKESDTPFFSIWDTDTVVDKNVVVDVVERLRIGEAEIAFPYNGIFLDTSDVLRELYLKKRNIKMLYRHQNKMEALYPRLLVGGAVFLNKKKFLAIGMDNEKHYGWSNDDFDRFCRARNYGLKVYNAKTCLFHLSHPRSINSYFRSNMQRQSSSDELYKTESSSKEDIINDFFYM